LQSSKNTEPLIYCSAVHSQRLCGSRVDLHINTGPRAWHCRPPGLGPYCSRNYIAALPAAVTNRFAVDHITAAVCYAWLY